MIERINDFSLVLPFAKKYFPDFVLQNDPFERGLCFKTNNRIVGFISYSIIYERAELNYIVTDEFYRRKGIAQEMFNEALRDLKNNMVENFSLEVSVNNKVAISFYLKNGFEIRAVRKKYYDGSDAYLMVLEVK